MKIVDTWFRDLPQQFLEKPNIEVLLSAFAKQLQEVEQVFEELNKKTDLKDAVGQNLDWIGTILSLTRKEAGELMNLGQSEPIISDERYRQILKYQLLRNTSDGTYDDILSGLKYLYDFQFYYREDIRYPATIILSMPLELDQLDFHFYRRLCIKPGGVGVLGEKKFDLTLFLAIFYETKLRFMSECYPRRNVPYLYYNGTAQYNGCYRYDKYKIGSKIDFYPVKLSMQHDYPIPIQYDWGINLSGIVAWLPICERVEKLTCIFDRIQKIRMEEALSMKMEVEKPHRFKVDLTVGYHLSRYDGTHRYNGTRRYDSQIIHYEDI